MSMSTLAHKSAKRRLALDYTFAGRRAPSPTRSGRRTAPVTRGGIPAVPGRRRATGTRGRGDIDRAQNKHVPFFHRIDVPDQLDPAPEVIDEFLLHFLLRIRSAQHLDGEVRDQRADLEPRHPPAR